MKLAKNLTLSMIVVLMAFSTISCENGEKAASEEDKETAAKAISQENLMAVDYAVGGMVCAMGCANTIQEEVAGMDGIAACNVDFEEGKAHIEFDKSQLNENEIIAKIESIAEGQYKVSEWKEKTESDDEEGSADDEGNGETEETIANVKLSSFEIPNLFTLLIDQL